MTFESSLRDAMAARVEHVDAPELRVRGERPRRVWPALVAGFAVVVVLALVVALLARRSDDPTPPTSTPYPSRIVAVTFDGKLQVLDSRTGKVIRTLARDADAANGNAGVSMSPDGKRVYYTRITSATCPATSGWPAEPIAEIASVSMKDGRVRTEAPAARWPAVSPDGTYLAYSGVQNCSDAAQSIIFKSLVPGLPDRRLDSVGIPYGTSGTVSELVWAPDSRHLLFRRNVGSIYKYVLDTSTANAIDDGRRIPTESDVVAFFGSAEEVLVRGQDEPGSVWTADPSTGALQRKLFGRSNATVGLGLDASVRDDSVLLPGAVLYRWTEGDRAPSRLTSRVEAAAWVPELGARPTVARPPGRIVALTRDGRLVVASSRDGHMIRLLAADYGGGGFALSPDGSTVYYARRTTNACGNPVGDRSLDLVSIPIGGGEPTLVASDALDPAVSPDGRWLAYSGVPNCSPVASSIVVRDLQQGGSPRTWASTTGGSRSVVSPWSIRWRDDRRILFALIDGPTRVLDTEQVTGLADAPVLPVAETDAICCRLGATGLMVGSRTLAGVTSVWTFDPSSGGPVTRLTWPGEPLDADVTGRHLLVSFTDPTHPPVLYRNLVGTRRLVSISSQLYDARWLPGS